MLCQNSGFALISFLFKLLFSLMQLLNWSLYLGNLTGYLKYDAFLINQLFQIGLQIQKQGTEFLNQLRVSHLPDCCYLLLHRYFLYSFARMLFCLVDAPGVHLEHSSLSLQWTENVTSPGSGFVYLGLFDGNGSHHIWTHDIRASWNHKFCPKATLVFWHLFSVFLTRLDLLYHIGFI